MQNKSDWKDVASSYYEKSVSLAVLILLFSFLVSPKLEVKPFERIIQDDLITIDIPEIKEKIKPPEQIVKPQIEIVIEDDLSDEDDEDIEIIDTIEKTTLDITEIVATDVVGKTPRFVAYEDAPTPIRKIKAVYPEFAQNAGLQGDVWVDVEVFKSGKVGAVEIKKSLMAGPGGLDEEAIKAVKQWEFQPAMSNGKPVSCWVTFPVGFYLE
jgi:periplasmic protein TonB